MRKNKNNKIVSTVNDSKSVKVNKSESKEVEKRNCITNFKTKK